MVALKKALTVGNVFSQKVTLIPWEQTAPKLYQAFGNPQNKGVWVFWGGSGSGKSSILLDVTKELCREYKAVHNELEEDSDDDDFIERLRLKNMQDVKDNFLTVSYNYEEMCAYLDKKNSPKVVVINSANYFFKDIPQYLEFVGKYRRNKIILISAMANGKHPYTELEKRIAFDANKKIFVEGYLAACKGRKIGPNGGTYIIWQEGYEKLRGQQQD